MAAPRRWLAAPLAAAIAVTLSCGGDTTAPTPPPPPPAPQPTTVSVTPSEVRLTAGDSAQLAAEVRDQNGQVMTGVTVAWTSSDMAVASVAPAGLVRAVGTGSATIAATAGQASGNAAVAVSPPAPPDRDRAGLATLYEATNGAGWIDKTNWLTDAPIGQWHGVTTDSSGAVVELALADNGLAGALPPRLGSLANIVTLELPGNALTGSIPPELGSLANLDLLDLGGNQLAGKLPRELGRLEKLRVLRLYDNKLTGAVPSTLLRINPLSFAFDANAGLCAPGTSAFVAWLAKIQIATGQYCNRQDAAVLETLYEFTGGMGWSNSSGWLEGLALGEWHGIGTDSTGRVARIDLDNNGLTGRLPVVLGQLAEMRELRIGNNSKLEGPLPPTLTSLELAELRYAGTGLCALDTPSFRDWLATVESHEGTGTKCMYTDRDVLASLYYATGGAGWTNSDKWLTDAPVGEWYGVTADGDGSVRGIDLDENGLRGPIPVELGSLAKLTRLSLASNSLEGEIPPELGGLDSLRFLSLAINPVSGSIPPELGNLARLEILNLHGLLTNPEVNQLAGPIPPELANLANLAELRLSYNLLWGEIPPALGTMPRLAVLELVGNPLAGNIPAELAGLASLRALDLSYSELDGAIPPELGRLESLETLVLEGNSLAGSIPAALGDLAQLTTLRLGYNALEGTIPPEVVRLPSLAKLELKGNRLTGAVPVEFPVLRRMVLSNNLFTGMIPAALGNVSSLEAVYLDGNQLTGGMPAELGSLGNLAELELSDNSLEGPVPAEFGGLAELEKFNVSDNPELEGPLPASLTGLGMLAEFFADGTALCAPADPAFLGWLGGIQRPRVRRCGGVSGSAAYLTQAVQSLDFLVPLVAGEPAMLRVFVSAPGANGQRMPPVRARFYLDGSEVHVANVAGPSAPIPTSLNEGDLDLSANASIPASLIQPGLEMVVEIDPDSALDASLGIPRRIPAEGRASVSVRETPELDFTIVPFLWREAPDSGIVRFATGLAADDPSVFGPMNMLLPVRDIDLQIHEAVVTATNDGFGLLAETSAIRTLEGAASDGYYMGMMSGNTVGPSGVADLPGRAGFSIPDPTVMTHELGHNFNLRHAPCGEAAGPDPDFPTPDGTIGAWGFDIGGDSLVAPGIHDIMSYCGPQWISDYHFTNAFGYRILVEAAGGETESVAGRAAVAAGPERTLLLWGGVGEGGEPFLEPAFIADAPPSLPLSPGGEYAIAGHDASGRELFSFGFDMPALSHGDGRSAFAYALPARQEWAGSLASITLSGPGGSFTLDGSSDRAAAILRDPLTGQVRGIFRDAPPSLMAAAGMAAPLGPEAAAALSLDPGLEVLASRGLPRPEDWRH